MHEGTPPPGAVRPPQAEDENFFKNGTVLAGRYEILSVLGEGGMGAVYKAKDRELNRTVALKVIRPELARNSAIVERFKHELRLSHQVTHKNVIRIYDLGEGEGVKFITMEFIDGQDLRSLIREKQKFSPEEAVETMRQVCQALDAAHSVGVIHRDLKPQNIIRDTNGRVLVMDFGLARTIGGDGMTQSGALVGTMEYMSPEQALGQELDQRSDLFALGLIFYELLTGKMPFHAESAIASLLKRTQERAVPVSNHDATIPPALSSIVSKCLERDPAVRYQNVSEVLQDLEVWQGKRAAATIKFEPSEKPWGQDIPWQWLGGIVVVLILAVTGFLLRHTLFGPTAGPGGPSVSLAILPFRNASGDPAMDWLGSYMADMLTTDVGQSAQLRTVNANSLHQIFTDLRISSSTVLDSAAVSRVADSSKADSVVWGQYVKLGDQIRIDASLQNIKNGRTVPLNIEVHSEKEIPGAIDRLADSIRQKLALSDDVLKELKASSFQPSSQSVAALRDYNQGTGLQRNGRNLEAQKQFEAAIKEDPNFALGLARLAQSYNGLGYDGQAEDSARKAVDLSPNLPQAEKYLIAAIRSQVTRNYPEAIKAYETLAKASPDNFDVQFALAGLYQESGNLAKARDMYEKLVSENPKDLLATLELGRVTIKGGDPQASLGPLTQASSLATQSDNDEVKAASLHLTAVAYRMLSKPDDVMRNEQDALAIWRRIGQQRGLALSLNEMAQTQAMLGKNKEAEANFREALQIRRDIGDKRGVGATLLDFGNFVDSRGDHEQSLKLYKESLQIQRDTSNESLQAICLNNIGSVYLDKGQYEDALTYFQQALQLREKSNVPQDIVEAVHNLGETWSELGQYEQAISYYLRALNLRRNMGDLQGAAIESYSLGKLFDYQGRFGAAIQSKQEAVKTLRDNKDKTFWMAKMLTGEAQSLILAGRGDEAKNDLNEALTLSRELKNDSMIAETLGVQGDAAFYRRDFKSAQAAYAQALQAATRSKDPNTILVAKADLAKVSVEQKRGQEAIASLRPLIQRADELGMKYVSVESSIALAEAMMQHHDNAQARTELERALLLSDKLGQKPLSARARYLLAQIAQASGNATEARDDYREVVRLLDEMKKDPGAEKLLEREDLKSMYSAATQAVQSAKG